MNGEHHMRAHTADYWPEVPACAHQRITLSTLPVDINILFTLFAYTHLSLDTSICTNNSANQQTRDNSLKITECEATKRFACHVKQAMEIIVKQNKFAVTH